MRSGMENAKDQFGRKYFGKITIRIPTTSSTVLRGQAACRLTQCGNDASRRENTIRENNSENREKTNLGIIRNFKNKILQN